MFDYQTRKNDSMKYQTYACRKLIITNTLSNTKTSPCTTYQKSNLTWIRIKVFLLHSSQFGRSRTPNKEDFIKGNPSKIWDI